MTDLTERDESSAETDPVAPPAHAAWALVLICVAQLMVVLDSTIANIALPYIGTDLDIDSTCLLYTSQSPRDGLLSRMPSSA